MKDYYKILEIQSSSTSEAIKKAYRTLSKKYHPDINKNGLEQFKTINEANAVLSDAVKRKEYDVKYNAYFKAKTTKQATSNSSNKQASSKTSSTKSSTQSKSTNTSSITVNGVKINVSGNNTRTTVRVVNGKVIIETS